MIGAVNLKDLLGSNHMDKKEFPWNMAIMDIFVKWKKRFEEYYKIKPDKYMCFRAGFMAGVLRKPFKESSSIHSIQRTTERNYAMKKYECDCGRVFTDPDGPSLCAQNNHGQPKAVRLNYSPGIKGTFEILYVYLHSGEETDILKARQLIDCTVSMLMQLERIKVKIQFNNGGDRFGAMGIIESMLSDEATASRARISPENMFDRPFIESETPLKFETVDTENNCPCGPDLDTKAIDFTPPNGAQFQGNP